MLSLLLATHEEPTVHQLVCVDSTHLKEYFHTHIIFKINLT